MWESHSEQKKGSAPGVGLDQDLPGMSGDSREPVFFRPNSLKPVGCLEVDSRMPVPVANVIQSDIVAHGKGGGGRKQSGCPPGNHVLPDCTTVTGRSGGSSGGSEGASGCWSKTAIGRAGGGDYGSKSVVRGGACDGVFLVWTPGTWGEQMFPGGLFFPVLATGLVGGWPGGTRAWSPPGNEGWSGREGQPPGSSGNRERLTPAGESVFLERPAGMAAAAGA